MGRLKARQCPFRGPALGVQPMPDNLVFITAGKTARGGLLVAALIITLWHVGARLAVAQSAVDDAFARLRSYDWGQSREALNPIEEAINGSTGNPARRIELATRLTAVLATNAPVAAKQWSCDKLSRIGLPEAIPSLAALLLEAQLSHAARTALCRIGGAGANKALLEAIPKAAGEIKIGLINSLGLLANGGSFPALTNLLADSDVGIAAAAASALGCLGTPEAAGSLGEFRRSAPNELQLEATTAWIAAAEHLVMSGHRTEAAKIFRELFESDSSSAFRLAGFRGLLAAEPAQASTLISQALGAQDDRLRTLAGRLLADSTEFPLPPFINALTSFASAGQIAVIDAVRWRKESAARPVVLSALAGGDGSVRVAALRALGTIGTAQDVGPLARLAAEKSGDEKEAARLALVQLPGKEINSTLVSALSSVGPEERRELITALAGRRATEARSSVSRYLADPSPSVRVAALEALGVLGAADQVPTLIKFLASCPDGECRESTAKSLDAIVHRAGQASLEALIEGLKAGPSESQVVLMRELGIVGGPKALEVVLGIVRQADSPLRGNAFRVLTEWSGGEALPELLRIAQHPENPVWGVLAFRGYVRLCAETPAPVTQKINLLKEAMAVAKTPEEKRLVISAFGELQDSAALEPLLSFLPDAALAEETCVAILKIAASAEPKNSAAAVAALRQVLNVSTSPEQRNQAKSSLERLGAKVD
jgi:HEAT repeat protein